MVKTIVVILIAIVLGLSGGSIYLLRHRQSTALVNSVAPPVSPTPVPTKTWTDQAGFILQYPSDLLVNKHDEDNQNYVHLEFTHAAHPGSLIVWAKDPPLDKNGNALTDISVWVSQQKDYQGASVIDTTLAAAPAKKIFLPEAKKTIVTALVDDLLYIIEVNVADASYWNQVQNIMTGSFAISSAQASQAQPADQPNNASDKSVVDEEEVLE